MDKIKQNIKKEEDIGHSVIFLTHDNCNNWGDGPCRNRPCTIWVFFIYSFTLSDPWTSGECFNKDYVYVTKSLLTE